MVHLKIRLPDVLFDALQASAPALQQSWEEIIRRALERYLDDFDDLAGSAGRLRPTDVSDPDQPSAAEYPGMLNRALIGTRISDRDPAGSFRPRPRTAEPAGVDTA